MIVSFIVAFVATFLGIGGGIIHVPVMSEILAFPVHLATGTSHFVLALTSTVASLQHFRLGNLNLGEPFLLPLAAGILFRFKTPSWQRKNNFHSSHFESLKT